jgi:hypothetical protein
VVFDDDFEEVAVLLCADAPVHLLADLFGGLHALLELEVRDLLLQQVLLGAQLERLDELGEALDFLFVAIELLALFAELLLLQLLRFRLPSLYLQDILGVLLFDFHEDPPHLNSFVEVLEDVLLDALDLLPLFDPAAVADVPLLPDVVVAGVDGEGRGFFLLDAAAFVALQLLLELLDFAPEVVDDALVLADVDGDELLVGDRLGLDVLGPVRVLEAVYGLLELGARRADVRDHHSLAVAPQAVLQDSRQLRVPVGHEEALLVLVPQGVDAVRQRQERPVDLGALHQPNPAVLSGSAPLRPRQVDQGELADQSLDVDAPGPGFLGDADLKDCVAPGAGEVGVGGFGGPALVAG